MDSYKAAIDKMAAIKATTRIMFAKIIMGDQSCSVVRVLHQGKVLLTITMVIKFMIEAVAL